MTKKIQTGLYGEYAEKLLTELIGSVIHEIHDDNARRTAPVRYVTSLKVVREADNSIVLTHDEYEARGWSDARKLDHLAWTFKCLVRNYIDRCGYLGLRNRYDMSRSHRWRYSYITCNAVNVFTQLDQCKSSWKGIPLDQVPSWDRGCRKLFIPVAYCDSMGISTSSTWKSSSTYYMMKVGTPIPVEEIYFIYDVLKGRKNVDSRYSKELVEKLRGMPLDPIMTEMIIASREEKVRLSKEMDQALSRRKDKYYDDMNAARKRIEDEYNKCCAEIRHEYTKQMEDIDAEIKTLMATTAAA